MWEVNSSKAIEHVGQDHLNSEEAQTLMKKKKVKQGLASQDPKSRTNHPYKKENGQTVGTLKLPRTKQKEVRNKFHSNCRNSNESKSRKKILISFNIVKFAEINRLV